MPTNLSELPGLEFLSLLLIAPARTGKTWCLGTAPRPIYIIASDPPSKLDSAGKAVAKLGMKDIIYDPCDASEGPTLYRQREACLREAQRGAAAGDYKTIAWDTFTSYADLALAAELRATDDGKGPDGRRAYDRFFNEIMSPLNRFLRIPNINLLVLAHDYPESGKIDGQLDKRGIGILPNIAGKSRGRIPALFRDVGYLQCKKESTQRVIKWHIDGCYGIGSNSRPGVEDSPADLTEFLSWRKDKGDSKGLAPVAPVSKLKSALKPK